MYNNLATFYSEENYFPRKAIAKLAPVKLHSDTGKFISGIYREYGNNNFTFEKKGNKASKFEIPFITSETLAFSILADTLKKPIIDSATTAQQLTENVQRKFVAYNRSVDSLYIPMMHKSDNFFAEQTLLMVSNKLFGYMSTDSIIDYVSTHDFATMPDKLQWADGSGLSRYNLFTPRDMVFLLHKMKQEFGLERLMRILPTGGKGTLRYYYNDIAGKIFAKTGTLNNNQALSGFLITEKGRLLIFSVMTNNYVSSASSIRRTIEKFLTAVRKD